MALPIFTKVKAGGAAGLLTAGFVVLLDRCGVALPADVIATIPPILGTLIAWLVPEQVLEYIKGAAEKLDQPEPTAPKVQLGPAPAPDAPTA